jgi:DNA-binding NarL/FixJ family response regulator
MSEKMYTIGIIEDDASLRSNYTDFFNLSDEFEVVFNFESVEAFQNSDFDEDLHPVDILLLDIRLPGISGIDAIEQIKKRLKTTAVIMLTALLEKQLLAESFLKGADGFLTKDLTLNQMKNALLNREFEYPVISPEATKMLIAHFVESRSRVELVKAKLTRREFEVAEEISKGFSYKEISKILDISTGTVNQHLKSVYVKLGIESRAQLAFMLNRS